MDLVTIFSSNLPIDCHILQGRLATDGIDSFIFDENIVCVDPFKAVAVGGVKLKVPADQTEIAKQIIRLLEQRKLIDESGEYEIASVFDMEIKWQNEQLEIKSKIRRDPTSLLTPDKVESDLLAPSEIMELISEEKIFQKIHRLEHKPSWKLFWSELFDFEGRIFKYLRPKPVEFYLEKELVENYMNEDETEHTLSCPNCKSDNVSYGYAIDYKWDVLYLVLTLVVLTPFPPIRKNHHCFSCGRDF